MDSACSFCWLLGMKQHLRPQEPTRPQSFLLHNWSCRLSTSGQLVEGQVEPRLPPFMCCSSAGKGERVRKMPWVNGSTWQRFYASDPATEKEIAQRLNFVAERLSPGSIQRIFQPLRRTRLVSRPGALCFNKGRIHLRRPPVTIILRLRVGRPSTQHTVVLS